jgi:predicted aconitase
MAMSSFSKQPRGLAGRQLLRAVHLKEKRQSHFTFHIENEAKSPLIGFADNGRVAQEFPKRDLQSMTFPSCSLKRHV